MSPAVFLDRDGVLNDVIVEDGVSRPPPDAAAFSLLPGVVEACRALAAGGYTLVVVTNQPDVARGKQKREVVDGLNAIIAAQLPVARIYTCFHDDADGCTCRKPKPGMLERAAAELGLDRGRSFMIGDRWRDIAAGAAAGCTTILVGASTSEAERCAPDRCAADLPGAAQIILQEVPA